MKKLHNSQYRLRKAMGILGIALPILLLLNHNSLLSSMSHYYYTSASVFFIGILTAFGLILFTYEGYPLDTSSESPKQPEPKFLYSLRELADFLGCSTVKEQRKDSFYRLWT